MPTQNVRFGAFRLDLDTGELFDNGRRVQLQEQPFKILRMLLDRPGEVVTREEIRRTLWSDDTIVEFDNSVNAAIKKLRLALGDSAESPTYVETLPRKGYRFIFPLKASASGGNNSRSLLTESGESMAGLQNAGGDNPSRSPAARATPHEVAEAEASSLAGHVVAPHRIRFRHGKEKQPMWVYRTRRFAGHHALWVLPLVLASTLLAVWLRSPLPVPSITSIVQITNDRRSKRSSLLTDGPRVYFSEEVGGHFVPVSVSANGGQTVPVPMSLPSARALDISPQGNELLLQSGGSLWVLPTMGGTARRLGNLEAGEATWSSDGEKLAYINGNDIYLAKSNGTESRKLVSTPAPPLCLRWAPDGRRLTVSIEGYPQGGRNSLWELSADGSDFHPRFPDWNNPPPSMDCCGRWTPDGRYFLFDSYRGGPDSIWAIRETEGTFEKWNRDPVRLTSGPMDTGKPLPSKDGKRIFFLGSDGLNSQLARYDSKSDQWVPYLSGISAEQVDFSKDGQWITYVSLAEANLFKRRVDGSEQLQLTTPPVMVSRPRWSPDGRKIAYMARLPDKPSEIRVISAEGGSPQPLTPDEASPWKPPSTDTYAPCVGECDPDWSPDGASLIFYRQPSSQEDASTAMPIHILDLHTNQVKRLPGSGDRFYPHWSPDGRYLAATADQFRKVVLFDTKMQTWVELTKGGDFYNPKWSRDGQYVYFIDWTPGRRSYNRVGIRDHTVERVANLGSGQVRNGLDGGGWVGLAPDDSPMAVIVFQEIYALSWNAP